MNLEKTLLDAFGEPTPKQQEFLTAKTRYVGYGGARGGGKSWAIRLKATLMAYEHPGIKILIVRRTFSDLTRLYIRELNAIYSTFPEEVRPTYGASERIFTFPNNSTIEFGYCETDNDADKYRGLEWDVLFLDEATDLSEYQYGILNSCVRGANKHPKRTYVTCNPGGIGHDNIKRLFITREYRKGEQAKKYTFIQARVWDNLPLLMSDEGFVEALKPYKRRGCKITEEIIKECMYASDYVQTLDNLPDEVREAHLNGDWNVFSGRFFNEFDPRVHTIPETPELLEKISKWRKSAAFDYGLDRFAVLWFAVDEHGNAICYRNYEESNLTVSNAALRFKELSRNPDGSDEKIEEIIAPVDMWNRRQDSGQSVAEIFAQNGLYLIQAGREREHGWVKVKEYISYDKDENGKITRKPKLLIVDNENTRRWIISHLQKLQFNIKKPRDASTEPHDITHSPDALRYWCSRFQIGLKIEPPKEPFNPFKKKVIDDGMPEVTEEYLVG